MNFSQSLTKYSNNETTGAFFLKHDIVTDLLLITLLWCTAAIIVNPYGNFPLNDDWVFGRAVKHLIEKGEYRPIGWLSMSLISQVLWGALFCVPFGFSFTALRFSTLLLSLFGIFGFYLIIRHLECPRWLAVIAALMLAFNPIYFSLSYSFMTDVPFVAMSLLAMLFLLKTLRSDSGIYLLIGTVMVVAAILCRQIGLFIPIAFGIALLIRQGISLKSFSKAVFPFVAAIGSLIIFQKWMVAHNALPYLYNDLVSDLLKRLQSPLGAILFSILKTQEALLNLGLFLFPLVVLTPTPSRSKSWSGVISIGTFILPAVFYLFMISKIGIGLMPVNGPILSKGGIGLISLYDTLVLGLSHAPTLPLWFWTLVTIISLWGAGLVLTSLVRVIQKVTAPGLKQGYLDRAIAVFFMFGATLYFAPLAVIGFSDRYLIPLVPLIAAAIMWERDDAGFPMRKSFIKISVFILALFFIYSIVGTKDFLQLNRVRWDALNYLMEQEGVKPSRIDGGIEFNGFYLYSQDHIGKPRKSAWVENDEYIIALGKIPGYEIYKQYPFYHWMFMRERKIYILKRSPTAKN